MIKAVLFDWGNVLRSKTTGLRARKVYRFAENLRSQGLRTGILSNMYPVAPLVLRLIGDYRGFDPVILSCEVNFKKPDPTIYQLAIKKLGVGASEIIFVDNLEENTRSANNLGIKTVLAKNPAQVIEDIKKILLKENSLKL